MTDDFACHKEGEHDHSMGQKTGKSLWVRHGFSGGGGGAHPPEIFGTPPEVFSTPSEGFCTPLIVSKFTIIYTI